MLKKILKRVGYTILSIIGLLVIYVLAAWLLPYITVNKNAPFEGAKEVSIFIKTNGVHTDVVLPMHSKLLDWNNVVPFENTQSKDTTFQYASFGWGDKGFYLQTPNWSDLKCSVAFKAMFHLSTSAMHVTFYKKMHLGENCKEIKISWQQYQQLTDYVKQRFQYDANGKTIPIPTQNDGYGNEDAFYEATGIYDLFHTCNTWANNALKAANQKACLWTALDKGIFYQYRNQ